MTRLMQSTPEYARKCSVKKEKCLMPKHIELSKPSRSSTSDKTKFRRGRRREAEERRIRDRLAAWANGSCSPCNSECRCRQPGGQALMAQDSHLNKSSRSLGWRGTNEADQEVQVVTVMEHPANKLLLTQPKNLQLSSSLSKRPIPESSVSIAVANSTRSPSRDTSRFARTRPKSRR